MRNIIITGGELFNKGAQAMVFITVDEIKKRFPDHEIYVLSAMDMQRPKKEIEQYAFRFTGWYPSKFAKCQSNLALRMICKLRNGQELKECESLYSNCDMMIDISGYALGSNWSFENCNTYLEHLEFAKAFHIPFYLMPQSFGPFEFQGEQGFQIDLRIRTLLPEARIICAREQDGYEALRQQYHLKNVRLTTDLVLNNKKINLANIYKEVPAFVLPQIEENSVGIVPNGRTVDVKNQKSILALYQSIIAELIRQKKNVYLLSHATSDNKLCSEIKAFFAANEKVVFLEQDFSCLEFNEIVKRFQFLIASRFHSIVHAYKNGIPCISIGWAVKYHDLLARFEQEKYAFDIRNEIDTNCLVDAVRDMNENRNKESLKIKEHLADLQQENIFDILSL